MLVGFVFTVNIVHCHMTYQDLLSPTSCIKCVIIFSFISLLLLFNRSNQMGQELRYQLIKIQQLFPHFIEEVRGKGLFNAVELNSKTLFPVSAYDICLQLKERGILAKPTHDTIIRLTPPLSMR